MTRTVQVADLEGADLDTAVALAHGMVQIVLKSWKNRKTTTDVAFWGYEKREGVVAGARVAVSGWQPSTSWAQGGPIIQTERIATIPYESDETGKPCPPAWLAAIHMDEAKSYGPTALIAAMRAFVASKVGTTIELPHREAQA